jgi:hypothetical protein
MKKKIFRMMDTQIDHILKQHIEWKDFCIESLKNEEFALAGLDATKNTMIKLFQRDKFFLELYLRAFKRKKVAFPPKVH